METIHEMYATLTEKKPSLAVSMTDDDGAVWRLTGIDPKMKTWAEESDIGKAYLGEKSAAALIRVRWEDALDDGWCLFKYGVASRVFNAVSGLSMNTHPDPITALYHFHMEQA